MVAHWTLKYKFLTDNPVTEHHDCSFDDFCYILRAKYVETNDYVLGMSDKHYLWIDSPSLTIFVSENIDEKPIEIVVDEC
jgi:hypothetical protein